MLTTPQRQINNIFERIVKDKNGILVRVRFIIVETNGNFQVKIVSATPFIVKKEKRNCLPCSKITKTVFEKKIQSFIPKVSPYFDLEFLMSQPTRAPSFR